MHEVFLNPHHVPVWEAACEGNIPDWRKLLAGYAATLDTPACHYWKELAHAFPNAKVLLLERDPDAWYDSMCSTTYQVIKESGDQAEPALRMIRRLFFDKCMAGRFEERNFAIAGFRRYCERAAAEIPKERLLVYEVSQGWAPLCGFLGFDIPETMFPKQNTREEFRARSRLG